jgi:hypothetical protein
MAVVMATFISGGGVATHVIPSWIHAGLFFAGLASQIRAVILEGRVLVANELLLRQVDRAIVAGESETTREAVAASGGEPEKPA